ncbi:MAG: DoxX family protein [Hamadaea sp.]|nr:DoxX family protein [Hamadaea sp.]
MPWWATGLMLGAALVFLGVGGAKLAGVRQSIEVRDQLGFSPGTWRVFGVIEVAGALGVLLGFAARPVAFGALTLLAAVMLVAIAAKLRVRAGAALIAADLVVLGLVAATAVAVATS